MSGSLGHLGRPSFPQVFDHLSRAGERALVVLPDRDPVRDCQQHRRVVHAAAAAADLVGGI